jgi:hypothetical protein
MDLSPYKEIINKKSKQHESFGYNSTVKALFWALILISSFFYGIIVHGWIGFAGSVFLSIIIYFLLGIGSDTTKRNRIEQNVKQEVIIPVFKQRLPNLKFEQNRSHDYEEVENSFFFSKWFKRRHLSGENLLTCSTQDYIIKMSEIKVSGISERYPLLFISLDFQNFNFNHSIYIRPKRLSFWHGRKKGENYMLFFNEPMPHEISVNHEEMKTEYYLSAQEASADKEFHDCMLTEFILNINKTTGKISTPSGTKIFISTQSNRMNILIMNFNLYRFQGMTPMNQLNTVEFYDDFLGSLEESIDNIVSSKLSSK